MSGSERKDQLLSIQYLRAIAALMVVVHHARHSPGLFNPLERYNAFAWGVDVFFVISGFIMYFAARHESPWAFLQKRLIRIVPLYWGATLALLAITTRMDFSSITNDEVGHLVKSLAFIPHYSPTSPDEIWPYLVPGWTLNYEMFFYFIFLLALAFKKPAFATTIAILLLFLAGFFLNFDSAIARTYTAPLLLEFLLGVWVARLYVSERLSPHLAWLLPIGLSALFSLPILQDPSLVLAGKIACSALIVAGAASIREMRWKSSLLKLLGDASYSIYLTHIVISLRVSSKLTQFMALEGWAQFLLHVLLSLIISSAIGVLVYRYFEKPILNWFRVRLSSSRSRPGASIPQPISIDRS